MKELTPLSADPLRELIRIIELLNYGIHKLINSKVALDHGKPQGLTPNTITFESGLYGGVVADVASILFGKATKEIIKQQNDQAALQAAVIMSGRDIAGLLSFLRFGSLGKPLSLYRLHELLITYRNAVAIKNKYFFLGSKADQKQSAVENTEELLKNGIDRVRDQFDENDEKQPVQAIFSKKLNGVQDKEMGKVIKQVDANVKCMYDRNSS